MPIKKKILITGTSQGIGKYLAQNFIKDGFEVHGISRSISIEDKDYIHYSIDLSNNNEIESLRKKISQTQYDIFIHNAGIHGPIGKFEDCSLNEWNRAFQINLFSGISILQMILDKIILNKGNVIFIAGGGSANSMKNFSAYSCSKTSIVRFCENFAEEYPNIRCHCISPGPNNTKLLDEAIKNGIKVDKSRIVDFTYTYNLCTFLINNDTLKLSGRQIHVKDNYQNMNTSNLLDDEYKLRRYINEKN